MHTQSSRLATAHLGPVEETLMIPLFGRALEAQRRRPLLRDPKAEAIVEALDYDFGKFDGPSLRAVTLRTRFYDRLVARWMAEHPGGVVVELGCGLNTRFERVDDGRVRWFDLDVPDVIDLWHRFFEESTRRTALAHSAFDAAWTERVRAEAPEGPWLFVSEASTLYFTEEENGRLYGRLADVFPKAHVLFDTASSGFVAGQDRHDALRHCAARVTWAVNSARELEEWRLELLERFPLMRPSKWLREEVPWQYRALAAVLRLVRPSFVNAYHLNYARLAS